MKVAIVSGILAALVFTGCTTTDIGAMAKPPQGGLLAKAEDAKIIGGKEASLVRKTLEWAIGTGELNPVKGWKYGYSLNYVGLTNLTPGAIAQPKDFRATATYTHEWYPFLGMDSTPVSPAASNAPPAQATLEALWKDNGGFANVVEALVESVDKEPK